MSTALIQRDGAVIDKDRMRIRLRDATLADSPVRAPLTVTSKAFCSSGRDGLAMSRERWVKAMSGVRKRG